MFTVLLATNRPEIRQAFHDFPSWEAMGYMPPRLFDTVGDAIASIRQTPPDAVAIDLPRAESAELYDLLQAYPHTLYMKAAADTGALTLILQDLAGMLERAGAQEGTAQALLPELRSEFFQTLLDGFITSERVLNHRLQALALSSFQDKPCALVRLSLPNGERYLQDVWRYGRARLGIAMHKFFQPVGQEALVAFSSLSAEGFSMLFLPLADLSPDDGLHAAERCAKKAIEDMAEYLGLEVNIDNMAPVAGLKALMGPKEDANGLH